jgi:hypothetical protein
MGTLHHFPKIPKTRLDRQSGNLSETILDFVRQLKCYQKLVEDSFQKLTEAPLLLALDRLKTSLADIDTIGRLLPPGELKSRFDSDRRALAAQLDLAKGQVAGLWEQKDLNGRGPV